MWPWEHHGNRGNWQPKNRCRSAPEHLCSTPWGSPNNLRWLCAVSLHPQAARPGDIGIPCPVTENSLLTDSTSPTVTTTKTSSINERGWDVSTSLVPRSSWLHSFCWADPVLVILFYPAVKMNSDCSMPPRRSPISFQFSSLFSYWTSLWVICLCPQAGCFLGPFPSYTFPFYPPGLSFLSVQRTPLS